MKIGKVLTKLAQDKRVGKLDIASDGYQVSIRVAEGFYAPKNRRSAAFQTAKAAQAFIKTIKRLPVAPEGSEVVFNLMTGEPVIQAKDTPHCCRVDSEAYWSM